MERRCWRGAPTGGCRSSGRPSPDIWAGAGGSGCRRSRSGSAPGRSISMGSSSRPWDRSGATRRRIPLMRRSPWCTGPTGRSAAFCRWGRTASAAMLWPLRRRRCSTSRPTGAIPATSPPRRPSGGSTSAGPRRRAGIWWRTIFPASSPPPPSRRRRYSPCRSRGT